MFEFLSSPFGLVAVGLGVLTVAVIALWFWITTLDRRMRGIADNLETERRKVAELQMIVGRRNNMARGYGRRPQQGRPQRPAPQAPPAGQMPQQPGQMPAQQPAPQRPMPAPGQMPAQQFQAPMPAQPLVDPRARQAAPQPPQGVPHPGAPVPSAPQPYGHPGAPQPRTQQMQQANEAWVQAGGNMPQDIVMPGKKMTRKQRREAERAFAERAAAELEARRQRRAQEVRNTQAQVQSQVPQVHQPMSVNSAAGNPRGRHAR